ncbi:enoyl-CoA hydratase/isomerase family protein [Oceanobacillus sp. HCA-5259]|uniref:enoyl-CoA hydratase/isomerase family protein n=1 Tax=Oceanobacillus sp. HCA-5259 TaxID=3134661 RepID=UPI0030C5365D
MDNVLFSMNENGVATITLNQPKSINALTHDMLAAIREKLLAWEQDDMICIIILKGAGPKGFCAGGDIKALYQAREQHPDALQAAKQFFTVEYQTDKLVAQYSKPIIACLDGIVMGGGVGLSYGASHRIVTERTKWAMPEMNIGFFPDVGAAYFLNKAPGYIGRYLALTATILGAADVLYIKGADHFIPSDRLPELFSQIEATNWHHRNKEDALQGLLQSKAIYPETDGELAILQPTIDKHFSYYTIEEIVESLAADPSEFAVKTRATLLSKSPVSLKVTLEQLIRGEEKTLEACLQTDLLLARNFMRHNDFFEGVRSVLIDKDQNPQYEYKQLASVSKELVNEFFEKS